VEEVDYKKIRESAAFKNAAGWLVHLGVLKTNFILPMPRVAKLTEFLEAGKAEPRILEVLPALIFHLPKAVRIDCNIPEELQNALAAMKNNEVADQFNKLPWRGKERWQNNPVITEYAKKRLEELGI
jgi:hypothetical protein